MTTDYAYLPGNNQLAVIDRQTVVHDAAGSLIADAHGRTYRYNDAGRFCSIKQNGETPGEGTPIRDYLWHEGSPVAQIDSTGTAERLDYLHVDHLGTPRLATGANQAVTWRWEGEVFGGTPPESFSEFALGSNQFEIFFAGVFYRGQRDRAIECDQPPATVHRQRKQIDIG